MTDAIGAKLAQAGAPGFRPKVAVILGSGLGGFAEDVKPVAAIPYGDLPVHLCGPDGLHRTVTLGQLLPMSFGPHHLETP